LSFTQKETTVITNKQNRTRTRQKKSPPKNQGYISSGAPEGLAWSAPHVAPVTLQVQSQVWGQIWWVSAMQ